MIVRLEYNTDTRKLELACGLINSDTATLLLEGFGKACGAFAGRIAGCLDTFGKEVYYAPDCCTGCDYSNGYEGAYEETYEEDWKNGRKK